MKYKILLNKGITPKNTEGNMYAKICEAMEEYHKSELLKLNKSDVISSVCVNCNGTGKRWHWEFSEFVKCSVCQQPDL